MADDESNNEPTENTADEQSGAEDPTFRERVEELRAQRAQAYEEGEEVSREEQMEEMMAGVGPGGPPNMGGGNPFAQMMGGGLGGSGGAGGPPEVGGSPREEARESKTGEEREVREVRDELHDIRQTLNRIGDAIEDS